MVDIDPVWCGGTARLGKRRQPLSQAEVANPSEARVVARKLRRLMSVILAARVAPRAGR
jgi:hypothetical protein